MVEGHVLLEDHDHVLDGGDACRPWPSGRRRLRVRHRVGARDLRRDHACGDGRRRGERNRQASPTEHQSSSCLDEYGLVGPGVILPSGRPKVGVGRVTDR
jgi:hypothetical protein